jgi:signal transduction histidine kinase
MKWVGHHEQAMNAAWIGRRLLKGELLPTSGGSLMSAVDESPDGCVADAVDHLRHELITPLTTIAGRTQLLARLIWRSPTLVYEERVAMLEGITAIETGVETLRAVIDTISEADRGS